MTDRPVCIVTDSTADIPPELARSLDITVIPCHIQFGTETFRDGIDITRQEFFRRLRTVGMFMTSQPPVGVFADAYRGALARGCDVIAVHLASRLCGLYSTASMAAAELDSQRITLIDSTNVSMCTGWLAILAAEAARAGQPVAEIVRQVQDVLPRLRLFAVIDDLRYLQRGGRVNWATSVLGSLFAIKPIIQVQDGEARLVEKARTLRRGIERLAEMAAELGPLERVAILHVDASQAAEQLARQIAPIFPPEGLVTTEAGAVVSSHAGPGTVGVACVLAR